jgi:outer membrane protein assembly factor BamB
VAWKFGELSPDVPTPLLYRGLLYVICEEAKTISCLDAKTGKTKWESHFAGNGPWRASPTGADGKIYCISEGGDFVVLAAGGEKFHELYRFALGARPCRSTIVAANGSLYLRLSKHLACVRKGGAKPADKPTE